MQSGIAVVQRVEHWTCDHSNKTRALIANLPNSAQLEGTPTIPPSYILGPCSCVGMQRGTDGHTHRLQYVFLGRIAVLRT